MGTVFQAKGFIEFETDHRNVESVVETRLDNDCWDVCIREGQLTARMHTPRKWIDHDLRELSQLMKSGMVEVFVDADDGSFSQVWLSPGEVSWTLLAI